MRIGLYEIIVNAIEHGNLGITYEEKSRAQKNNSYVQLLQDRKNKADEEEKRYVSAQPTIVNGSLFR